MSPDSNSWKYPHSANPKLQSYFQDEVAAKNIEFEKRKLLQERSNRFWGGAQDHLLEQRHNYFTSHTINMKPSLIVDNNRSSGAAGRGTSTRRGTSSTTSNSRLATTNKQRDSTHQGAKGQGLLKGSFDFDLSSAVGGRLSRPNPSFARALRLSMAQMPPSEKNEDKESDRQKSPATRGMCRKNKFHLRNFVIMIDGKRTSIYVYI